MKKISYEKCLQKAYSYVGRFSCSGKRLFDYLVKKGCQEFASDIIKKFTEEGILDEEKTCRFLAENYLTRFGKKAVEKKLVEKGFSPELVKSVLSSFDYELELESALSVAEKKLKSLSRESFTKKREKLLRFLLSRGFGYEISIKAVNKIFSGKHDH